MRIVHITPDYHPATGGGELYVKEVSERLAARGHDVTVVAMNSRGLLGRDGAPLPARETVNRVKLRRLNRSYKLHERFFGLRGVHKAVGLALGPDRSRMLSLTPWSLRAFVMTLAASADIVGVFNWYHGSLAYQTAVARDLGRFRFVGFPFFHTERPWARSPFLATILARCDVVAAMTDYEKRFAEERSGRATARVVGAGVDPAPFAAADGRRIRARYALADAPVVGCVGRIAATKGVVTLVEAMRIVWRCDPGVRLLLAGSGLPLSSSHDGEVRAVFACLSEAERSRIVTVSSFRDDEKPALFDALDVFAMPSVAESFGIAYLEAWMRGKPVVGSRIGSTECVIRDGVDGLLVAPGDHEDLAVRLGRLIADRAARDRMGEAGRDKVLSRFTWDKVTDRVEMLYIEARALQVGGTDRHRAVA